MDVLEVHVTLSREMFGPDVLASVTTGELRQLVDGIRFIERMRAHPVDKDASAAETAPLRRLFTRSLVARQPLPAGTVLAAASIWRSRSRAPACRPTASTRWSAAGCARAVAADQLLPADVEGARREVSRCR